MRPRDSFAASVVAHAVVREITLGGDHGHIEGTRTDAVAAVQAMVHVKKASGAGREVRTAE